MRPPDTTPSPPAGGPLFAGTSHRNEWLRRYLLSQRSALLWGVACLLATSALALSIPWLIRLAIEEIRSQPQTAQLLRYSVAIFAAALVGATSRTFSRTFLHGCGREVEYMLRSDLVAHLLRLPLSQFRAGRVGDLLSRVSNDVSEVRMLAGPGVLQVVNTCVNYAGALGLMLAIDPVLTLAGLIPYPFLSLLFYHLTRWVHQTYAQIQRRLGDLSARLQESLSGAMIVKCHGIEEREIADLISRSAEYKRLNLKFALVRSFLWPFVFFLSGIGLVTVLKLGGDRVSSGRMSLGALVAFLSYYAFLLWPTIGLGWLLGMLQRGLAAADRIHDVLSTRPEAAGRPSDAPGLWPAEPGRIELQGVRFAYPMLDATAPCTSRAALDSIDLTIEAGQLVALVGPTGSGKSTLVSLLVRLWGASAGTILLDGIDVMSLPLTTLRQSVCLVPQDPVLFSLTVEDNIRYGKQDATALDVRRVATWAHFAPDVPSLPDGWATRVGEGGLTLSRGQRQRIALARALLIDPSVLLLDDTFSAVDTQTEEAILSTLRDVRKARTTLLVTHRVTTAGLADRVLVLEGGRIVESGTHGELIGAGGSYARLARLQRIASELDSLGTSLDGRSGGRR